MPFVIETDVPLTRFPETCVYCGARPADGIFHQTLGRITSTRSSEARRFFLAACSQCSRWFTRTRVAIFVLGFGALLLPLVLAFVLAARRINGDRVAGICFALFVVLFASWAAFRVMRWNRARRCMVAYVGPQGIAYALANEREAQRIAQLNGLTARFERVIVRLT